MPNIWARGYKILLFGVAWVRGAWKKEKKKGKQLAFGDFVIKSRFIIYVYI